MPLDGGLKGVCGGLCGGCLVAENSGKRGLFGLGFVGSKQGRNKGLGPLFCMLMVVGVGEILKGC